MPRGAVNRLIGTIAHPLNMPIFDPAVGRVTRGYGVLQPRMTPTLPAERDASIFQRVYSGSGGIDPYSAAVSDVYQDLFGEGSFTGKGIYDIDVETAGRVPENVRLSHDRFECVFARAGLVTDVEHFDEFTSNYLVAASRLHRWARGDWQLLPWILGRARNASGERTGTSMPGIARWKMVDNLRRTLSAPLAVLTLVAAWSVPGVPAVAWTAFVLGSIIIPAIVPVAAGLRPQREGISRRSHIRAVVTDAVIAAAQVGIDLTLLAHQAWLMADAIGRSLVRRYVTRRHLLEWTTAAHAKAIHDPDRAAFHRQMAGAMVIAIVAGVLTAAFKPGALWLAGPFVVLWLLSPLIARWISLPPPVSTAGQLAPEEVSGLRLLARRTWRYFETFVGPDDNALPPDNFQDEPQPLVAHRTSPTNIGMYLLATVTARDFGWIGTTEMVERLEATLATVDRLRLFQGHLYNWYDTRTLEPLEPMYVSSVDSGKLAGHLLALENACRQMLDLPLPIDAARAGIADAVALSAAVAAAIGDERRSQTLTRRDLDAAIAALDRAAPDGPMEPSAWAAHLDELAADVRVLSDVVEAFTTERGDRPNSELVAWADAALRAVESHRRDLRLLGPAAAHLATLAELADPPDTESDGVVPAARDLTDRLLKIG